MKSIDYPRVFTMGREGSRAGLQNILFWHTQDLYLPLKEYEHGDDLKANLIKFKEEYFTRLQEKDGHIIFNDDFINDVVDNFYAYKNFLNQVSIEKVAQNLEYHDESCYPSPVLNSVFEYFSENFSINLYSSDYYNIIEEKYYMKHYVLDGYEFVSLNGCPTFVIYRDSIIQVNPFFYSEFINDIFDVLKQKAKHYENTEDFKFPVYVEYSGLSDDELAYVCIDGKFFEYNKEQHKGMSKFKKVLK